MTSSDRYLYEDINTAKKIEEDPTYYDQLQEANKYIDKLKIKSKIDYYKYSMVIKELKYIPYIDIQSFRRFQDEEYYEYIKSKIIKPKKHQFRIIKREN